MDQWKDAALRQVKLLTTRLNEGLRSEFGVDLGLNPDLIPPWALVLAACAGLLLMAALWASVCRAVFKKRPAPRPVSDRAASKPTADKAVKPEEPKKKKKKKAQPNGRAVAGPQEEALVPVVTVPHQQPPPQAAKAEKIPEGKKSKKKAKPVTKETKIVTADGKEPEEGTWETKVSNKEKREQRKKDKGSSDGSASPGGGDTPVSTPHEQPKAPASAPLTAKQKKKQAKAEKADAAPQVNNREAVNPPAPPANVKGKGQAHTAPPKTANWSAPVQPAQLWRGGIDDSWTVIEKPSPEPNRVSVGQLGGGPAQSQRASGQSWFSAPRVDDEWSGINGSSADPSSDWNAPSEAWVNYEDGSGGTQGKRPPESGKLRGTRAAELDNKMMEKGDAVDGAAKAKKKKKKKKSGEDGATQVQVEEPVKETPVSVKKQTAAQQPAAPKQQSKAAAAEARAERVKDVPAQKAAVTQVPSKSTGKEAPAKQNNLPAPAQQKKPEEIQAPKQAKKKKVRRET